MSNTSSVRITIEQTDDVNGFFFAEWINEIRRQMAIAQAQDTANQMAAIVRKYYP